MRIGKFRKSDGDRKRYVIDYADWLDAAEIIEGVVMVGDVPLDNFYADGYIVNAGGKEVIFYVSGGLPGVEYDVQVTITTSMQQVKEDWVTFVVTL